MEKNKNNYNFKIVYKDNTNTLINRVYTWYPIFIIKIYVYINYINSYYNS